MKKQKRAIVVRDYYNEIVGYKDPMPYYERFKQLSDTPENVTFESIVNIMNGHASVNKYSYEDIDDSVEYS